MSLSAGAAGSGVVAGAGQLGLTGSAEAFRAFFEGLRADRNHAGLVDFKYTLLSFI
jgi:hypothetical protein